MATHDLTDTSDVNRRYFVHYVSQVAAPGSVVLDYGCGLGTNVNMLRQAGFEAYGVEIKWPGADYGDLENDPLVASGVLRFYEEGGRLPFDDDIFDVVVSDQVFEHVVPLEASLLEIERVVRPDGVMYHHFPSRKVWREGHIGIPFTHRMPPGRARLFYTAAMNRLGFGIFKNDMDSRAWAAKRLKWIDEWTVYRPPSEIAEIFGRNATVTHREMDYCRFRAGDRRLVQAALGAPGARRPVEALFRRLGFDAIEARPFPAGGPAASPARKGSTGHVGTAR